jgi:hypothetical protein
VGAECDIRTSYCKFRVFPYAKGESQCTKNLKQVDLAIHNDQSATGALPPTTILIPPYAGKNRVFESSWSVGDGSVKAAKGLILITVAACTCTFVEKFSGSQRTLRRTETEGYLLTG